MTEQNRRILLIDDTPSIHEDFRKILTKETSASEGALADAKAAFFGEEESSGSGESDFELDSAYQGQEGLEMLLKANKEERPYAMAFVDVRMPPGWDGIQTIKQLWKSDHELQVVICTAYSDYSWDQTIEELGQSDRLLILKKPFDSVEIRQLASALTEKWNAARRERTLVANLKNAEAEARAYASSLETMNQALMTAKATSERASEMKTDFLVHLSTQVNQNLTSILDRVAQTGQVDGLDQVLTASRHLMRTLDRILDLTQLEGGQLDIDKGESPSLRLVQDILEEHRSAAEAKDLDLNLSLPSAVPETIECDERRLRQILTYLVENAITYTEQGEVQVKLSMEPTSDWQRSVLRVSVRDTGKGIPEEIEGRLYEPFVGAGTSGAGLGLALTRSLARLMGGDVTHESQPDGGTEFTVSFEVGNISGVKMIDA